MWTATGVTLWAMMGAAVVVAVVALALLHQTSNQVKRFVTVALTFAAGLFYFLEFFIPPHPTTEEAKLWGWSLTQTASTIGNAAQVVAGFTFLLGVYNLVHIHSNHVRRQRPGWGNSIAFFTAFLAMTVAAFWRDWHLWFGSPEAPTAPLWIRDTTEAHSALPHDAYTFLFEGFYRSMDATMFSILAFYIVSAAYRAFRIRSGEAAVLMIVAVIMMLGQVPLGMALTNWIPKEGLFGILRIESFSQYLLTAVNSPVQRAIGFGLGLGALAMALRIWLSLERGTYFGEEA